MEQKPSLFSLDVPSDSTDGSFFHVRSASASLPMQRFQALSSINQSLLHKRMPSTGLMYLDNLSLDAERSKGIELNEMAIQASSFRGSIDNPSWNQLASTSETSPNNQVPFPISFWLEFAITTLPISVTSFYRILRLGAT